MKQNFTPTIGDDDEMLLSDVDFRGGGVKAHG